MRTTELGRLHLGRQVGYLLPVGALVCNQCAATLPAAVLDEPMYAGSPEVEIDNSDCDNCGEPMRGPE